MHCVAGYARDFVARFARADSVENNGGWKSATEAPRVKPSSNRQRHSKPRRLRSMHAHHADGGWFVGESQELTRRERWVHRTLNASGRIA